MSRQNSLEQAILRTVLYADIFQYPLTEEEVYRYLAGIKATRQAVHDGLQACLAGEKRLARCGPYYLLPGREEIAPLRLQRAQTAARLWPRARFYGRLLAHIPFVRMIAITGSLAMNNVDPGGDLDYLVVTQPGRLWLARGLAILLVHFAALHGDRVCPNYFLSERALYLDDQNLFSAHELVQMVPLAGMQVYTAMRQENLWVSDYLPNAGAAPDVQMGKERLENEQRSWIQKAGERFLQSRVGDQLESWEMQRKLRKFHALARSHAEAQFGPDFCKGHVDDHEGHTLHSYTDRLQLLERIHV